MTEKLPGVLAEIAELVGEQAALIIASRAGGTRVYFPATVDDKHWLVASIGRAAADKVCAHFMVDHRRGQHIEIPLSIGGTFSQLVRAVAKRVKELDDGGASASEIVRQVGITGRSVHRHRARHRGDKDGVEKDDDKKPKQGRLL